ncbi:hypothetical protein B0H10DRAFT_2176175 [Mycena sp. CBHHK59/15]|nr:hypothetical protein B0H10DRAFT_2176175 [Mycena sp. CBHHK59/15]
MSPFATNSARTKLSLPRTLPQPVVDEVDTSRLVGAYPDLAGVPAEYIRDRLPLSTPKMRAALQAVETSVSKSALPKELEILMNDIVAAACPTHMLAIYADAPLALGQKRHVSLFPMHDIVFAAHCARLPAFPASQPPSAAPRHTIPVVPLCIPSPETFPLLQSYLYTQQPTMLLTSLQPPRDSETDLLQLATHAMKIHGLWRNACALGVVDERMYAAIEASWDSTIAAMQVASRACLP